jgi:hypothetical protein
MRLDDTPGEKTSTPRGQDRNAGKAVERLNRDNQKQPGNNAMAQLFAAAQNKKNNRL